MEFKIAHKGGVLMDKINIILQDEIGDYNENGTKEEERIYLNDYDDIRAKYSRMPLDPYVERTFISGSKKLETGDTIFTEILIVYVLLLAYNIYNIESPLYFIELEYNYGESYHINNQKIIFKLIDNLAGLENMLKNRDDLVKVLKNPSCLEKVVNNPPVDPLKLERPLGRTTIENKLILDRNEIISNLNMQLSNLYKVIDDEISERFPKMYNDNILYQFHNCYKQYLRLELEDISYEEFINFVMSVCDWLESSEDDFCSFKSPEYDTFYSKVIVRKI